MLFTWERAMEKTFFWKKRFADHYERYELAKKYCKGKNVLDAASWSWYWSFILSQVAEKVNWLDISKEAIEYCKKYIKNNNLNFILGDGKKIPFKDNSFDIVISFETIEHIKDYNNFLEEIKKVLKKDWILIMSTPNFKWEIRKNKWHVSNFNHEQFISAVSKHFKIEKELFQWKHFYAFPWRGILETIFGIKRDIKIHEKKPNFEHSVSIVIAKNIK